jgi:large subunit ribosomal protein L23
MTEKADRISKFNKYVFWVDKRANKIEIRDAIERFYKVKIKDVNVINVKGKTKRLRWGQEGKTSSWKKAIVTLKKGYEIKVR